MTTYLDTSAAIPLFVPEPASDQVTMWLESNADSLVSADWILTEFASALSVKIRRGELAPKQANAVLDNFSTFTQTGLRLVEVNRGTFVRAVELIQNTRSGLRAGDALHLATALETGAETIVTADGQLEKGALFQGLCVTKF